ncbi:fimbrial protein [Bacillus sp. FJAT-49705]|uniref:Fimbrial protein n=1 Tax=Cytobacillus citreus TaxID=2833586 RepID=A0ABS5NVP7_9BACI|nr:fimbrial protein [Cytobacillus citreus]MBS4191468.1 fimbrial protein [Cytobacillus citreus]
MLVEINLLPKKESRNTALFVLVGVFFLLLLVGIFITMWVGQSYKAKLKTVEQQISTTQQLIEIDEKKITDAESANSQKELEKAVEWAKEYPIKTVPLLRKFTALLPERGFIQSFQYEETGNIQLLVQFDTKREASYYLKSMLDADWIEDVRLITLTANEPTEEETEQTSKMEHENQYIPRYLANYEIILNRSVIKADLQVENQGGNES